MTKILAIALKDLRSTARNVPALVMMLVAPLALAGLLGFAFGGGGNGFQIAATKVAFADLDKPVAAQAGKPAGGALIGGILGGPGLKGVLAVTRVPQAAAARSRVDDGKAAAAIIVPAGFSGALYGNGGAAAVELYQNPTRQIGDAITSAVVGQTLLDFNGARAAAAAAVAAMGGGRRRSGGAGRRRALHHPGRREPRPGGHGTGAPCRRRDEHQGRGRHRPDPGRHDGVLHVLRRVQRGAHHPHRGPRRHAAATAHHADAAGHHTGRQVQLGVPHGDGAGRGAALAGRLLFSIHWGRLDAVTLLTLAGAAVASSLALLIISLVRTPGQAGAIGAGVYLILALLGGNFTGTATVGTTYATVQKLTPNGWLISGWDTVMRGGGLTDIAAALLVPLAFAAVFFAVAVVRFRRRYA